MITIRARPAGASGAFSWHVVSKLVRMDDMPVNRPPVIRDQDRVDVRLTEEAEYRIPFTFIEALNEGTLADRPAHAFLDAARERRLFHVLNRTTDNIVGTGVIQMASGSAREAEVGGLLFHPAARGFGLAALLVKIMMVYAIKESGRDSPDEEYLAHVVDGNGAPLHALLDAGFRPIGPVDVHRGDIDAVIDHMIKDGDSAVRMQGFLFDREVIGRLVLALWKFVNEDHGVITRSSPAGNRFQITVDFSHVIPPIHLSL
jgi:GNAT superfamily N-acetyltransferase